MKVNVSKWMTDYYHISEGEPEDVSWSVVADLPQMLIWEYQSITKRLFQLNRVLQEAFTEAGGTDAQH